jgi:hypothetical protein
MENSESERDKLQTDTFSPEIFYHPTAEWRGKPFWSWNGELDRDELLRQIHVFKKMGMGGFFMHSRVGLATEYLGDTWFELTTACAEEGERLGMESWLYDEDRWPSGTAGGRVTENPDYRMKFIYMEIFSEEEFDLVAWKESIKKPMGVWRVRLENKNDIFECAPFEESPLREDVQGMTILAFSIRASEPSSFFNGNTYVDTLKREATEEYIRLTHEAYKAKCGHLFGSSIKGIFTDEPNRGPFMSGFGGGLSEGNPHNLIPWSEDIFDVFYAEYGYRAEQHLPALFLRHDGLEVSPIKSHYAEILLKLFLQNFAKPCFDWCEANNLMLTGHILHENSLASQVSTNGSVQRYYPFMHVPGVDYLGEHGRHYWVAKQVDSVARQIDKRFILSELYGLTGWQMNFESHKAIGAWQALFGVNLRCHHLSWFTMQGESKRDYPASILHQSPWYKEYNHVETWFARLGYFRSQGNPCCDLLVLNPVESVWGRVYPGAIDGMGAADEKIKALDDTYAKTFHLLAGNHIDFDYGDEALMAEHANVITRDGRALLSLGAMVYTTVLIAGVETVRSSTFRLLDEFARGGGNVVFAGDRPSYVDSIASDAVGQLASRTKTCELEPESLVAALESHTTLNVNIWLQDSGKIADEVYCQPRMDGDVLYLTVLNMNRDECQDIRISIHGIPHRVVEEWDLDTGKAFRIPVLPDGSLSFKTRLNTSQARCFRVVKESDAPQQPLTATRFLEKSLVLKEQVSYSLADENICVLDTPFWAIHGESRGRDEILQIDRKLRRQFDVPVRGGSMLQPWFRGKETFQSYGELVLRYTLHVDAECVGPMQGMQLVMEKPEKFMVRINGRLVDTSTDSGWWVDVAFRRISLPEDIFLEGKNEIVVSCQFSEDIDLEALYLVGNFSVTLRNGPPFLGRLKETIQSTDIVRQGMPYYSGSITYHFDVPPERVGQKTLVRIPAYEGAYVKLHSGDVSTLIPWRPNEAEMVLAEELHVEVCVTRKNTFGPLHLTQSRPNSTTPGSFVPSGEGFSLNPVFMEAGILGPIELVWYESASAV